MEAKYQVPNRSTNPAEYAQYLDLNAKTFCAINYGTSESTLRSKVSKHRATKDGRGAFLELDAYQKGQGSEETCAEDAWGRLNKLKLTPLYSGGVEKFLGDWDDVAEDLQDVGQVPNDFLEWTLLKAAILDEEFQGVITNLDMK